MFKRILVSVTLCAWPALADQFVVTSAADSGEGTLREAIELANANDEADLITFELPVDDYVIRPTSPLPNLASEMYITVSGAGKGISGEVVLSGESAGDTSGIVVSANNCYIEGLTIVNFERSGIEVSGPISGTQIYSCKIGSDGTECLGNFHHGILFEGGAFESTIFESLISGNGYDGVRMLDAGTSFNYISGSLIGTDLSGTISIGNGWRSEELRGVWTDPKTPPGVELEGEQPGGKGEFSIEGVRLIEGYLRGGGVLIGLGATENYVSSFTENKNVISGNYWYGVKVVGEGTDDNFIVGNTIGMNVFKTAALANEEEGIHVRSGAKRTNIGLATFPDEGNFIGGNNIGIKLDGPGVEDTVIVGNKIGVAFSGEFDIPVPNRYTGITIEDGVTGTLIGSGNAEDGNFISYNSVIGIQIKGLGTNGHTILRNQITANVGDGLFLGEGANDGIQAPVILSASVSSISGTAAPGLVIEVYADAEDEGGLFLGQTTSDGEIGAWELTGTFAQAGSLNATAIATDLDSGNSSDFSAPVPITEPEGATDGEGEPEIDLDLLGDMNTLRSNPLGSYIPEPYYSYLFGLDPATGDFNGGVELTVTALPSDNPNKGELVDSIAFLGNGIPDAQEFSVIEYLIENPDVKTAKISGQEVKNSFIQNRNQIKNKQLGPNLGAPAELLVPGALNLFAVFTMLGDGEVTEQTDNTLKTTGGFATIKGYFGFFAAGVAKLGANPIALPQVQDEDYITLPILGPDGDLDGDGKTNKEEWDAYGPTGYVEAVLDPEITPPGEGEGSAEGEGSSEGEGAADGEGSVDGEGANEGTVEGTSDGEGVTEGTVEGEGGADGEGTSEGSSDGEGATEGSTEGNSEGTVDGEGSSEGEPCDDSRFTADLDNSGSVSLSEVLRMIQLYNADAFSCATSIGEDDIYQLGLGSQNCCPHKSDYLDGTPDWTIKLSELLRVIQFYNSAGWSYCPGGAEDNFCPVFPN